MSNNVYYHSSVQMSELSNESINLVVTSPPYPMIEMWDFIMVEQNPDIAKYIDSEPKKAFELMHQELDKVWKECFRVIKNGGFLCVNIGDATRTINSNFALYNNHSRISKACIDLGFVGLPNIIWRKQTNAPNKFMGSGMLPCGAYVTLEHEWILIFRKGDKRTFKTANEKLARMESAFFWEERNVWFSDIWEIKGTKQKMNVDGSRQRSAAFPIEIPLRLINMYSCKGDTILDPFLGLGTTMKAAIITDRNCVGYEIDETLKSVLSNITPTSMKSDKGKYICKRLLEHFDFVRNREKCGKEVKHYNENIDYKVMTKQETEIKL